MKSLFLFLSLSLMAFTASAECGDANAHKTSLDSSTAGITKINVSGMACSACVDKLSKEVAKITKSEGKIWVYTTSENLYVIDIKQNNIVAQYRPKNMSLLNFYQNTYEGQHELKKRLQENKLKRSPHDLN